VPDLAGAAPAEVPTIRRRRAGPIALAAIAVPLLASGAGGLWLHGRLRASLPQLAGERRLPGLAAPARVERDAHGVPWIRGASRPDVSRALGFLHGQERFFQMDLMRRRAAGEIAELVGAGAADLDRKARVHRFRPLAGRVWERAPEGVREDIVAYAAGVNTGLAALGAPPFEYLVLGADPAPWRPEDTVLISLAMFITLQGRQGEVESAVGLVHDLLPAALAAFLVPDGTVEWDAPIVGGALAGPPVPGPEVVDLRRTRPSPSAATARSRRAPALPALPGLAGLGDPDFALGSNSWAVAGAHTASGAPLLADDMHLQITVPNIWYRASLAYPDRGVEREVGGVTLPGTPVMVAGSNRHVAWGHTNTEGDWADLVVVERDPGDPDAYLTPEGPRKLRRVTERIRVKGAPDATLEVVETVWGPIVDEDHRGRPRALRWVAHEEEGVNLALGEVERARTLAEAQEAANRVGSPAQNFVAVDEGGHIGWTVMGRIPRRVGFDGRRPGSWADGTRRWDGWLPPSEYPRVVDPPSGRIWTANSRVVGGTMLATLGFGGYDLGARASQIRDALLAIEKATPADMLRVQLDDRALFLARWRELLLATLTPEAGGRDPRRAEMRALVEGWGGRASIDSAGYRIVRAFRGEAAERVLGALTAPCEEADERFEWSRIPFHEGPLWALVTERPVHLLPPPHASWEALLLAAADAVAAELTEDGSRLSAQTWGRRNTALIRHPLSRAVPALGRFLDMPRQPLPGDSNMPRAQGRENGASERLAVSPGREAEGILHVPAGQSGHPLSPHYADGHAAWVAGEATPFLPGPAVNVLVLRP